MTTILCILYRYSGVLACKDMFISSVVFYILLLKYNQIISLGWIPVHSIDREILLNY